jgi:hypothetical protein
MKSALKILFVVSMASLIAACGPHGHRNNGQNTVQNQNVSAQNNGFRQGGGLRRVCAADIQKFCNGQDKLRKCLRDVSGQLQPDCKTALEQAIERSHERRLERRQIGNGTQPQGQMQNRPQGQNQTAPQNGQRSNSSNDDDN